MPVNILMLALSPTMKEGKLVRWLVKEGDKVQTGDVVAEVETDKAIMELESPEDGTIGKIIVGEDTDGIEVSQRIGVILQDGESAEDISLETSGKPSSTTGAAPTTETGNDHAKENTPSKISSENSSDSKDSSKSLDIKSSDIPDKVPSSPLARRVSKEKGIDISSLFPGSGPKGRVVIKDVEGYIKQGGIASSAKTVDTTQDYADEFVAHTPMRRAIADNLVRSKRNIPHFYLKVTCKVDGLLSVRSSLNKSLSEFYKTGDNEEDAPKVSINDFFVKSLAMAFKDVPEANVSWHDEGMTLHKRVDIGIAVSIDGGLITPVVRDADKKSLKDISLEAKGLIKKARNRTLKPQEYQGACSIVSNLGMYDIEEFSAIISPDQSSIMAVGSLRKVPVFNDDNTFKAGHAVTLVMSVDHRAIDGVLAAKLLNSVKKRVENPISLLVG